MFKVVNLVYLALPAHAPTYPTDDCCLITETRSRRLRSLGWHSYASRQSNAHQLPRQSFQCSWTASLELSADGLQTAGLVIQPFQTVSKDVVIWSVGLKCSVNLPLTVLSSLLTALLRHKKKSTWNWFVPEPRGQCKVLCSGKVEACLILAVERCTVSYI